MPSDSRRIFGPENIVPPSFYYKNFKKKDVISEHNLRQDGRKLNELRQSVLKLGVVSEAAGSAYYEYGNTKIICSVFGPRDVTKKSEFSFQGQLSVDFKYATFSSPVRCSFVPNHEEKDISLTLQESLESVVLMNKFPKARVEIFIIVLENDGSAISGALTCAGAALANAGIEMYDLVIGCSMRQYGSISLVDPNFEEEQANPKKDERNNGNIILGMMPKYNQVVLLIQNGELDVPVLTKCMKDLMLLCETQLTLVNNCLLTTLEDQEKCIPSSEGNQN